jgi:uncharacterized protein
MPRTDQSPPTTHHRPPGLVAKAASLPFVIIIWAYRVTLSPFIGGQCKHTPTCSRYALEAYRVHGPIHGTILTIRRILSCNPFAHGGYDPVPINEPPTDSRARANSTQAKAPSRTDPTAMDHGPTTP